MQTEQLDGFPLSPQQKSLWLLQQKQPSLYYRTQGAIFIEGYLEKDRLIAALETVVKKQEILRTIFHKLPEMDLPLQVIADGDFCYIEQYNWQELPSQEQLNRLELIFQEMLQKPLKLEKYPVFDLALVQLSEQQHWLIVGLPGLCADRFSLNYLMVEISNYYAQIETRKTADNSLQYVDFSQWQNDLLESEETAEGRAYWEGQSLAFNSPLTLPLSRQKNNTCAANFQADLVSLTLDNKEVQEIQKVIQKYRVSLGEFFLSCFLIFLGRMTNQSEVSLGLGSDNRHYEDLAQSLGLMTKYLPLSTALEPSLNFAIFCQQIAQKAQELVKWQDYFTPQAGKLVGNGITFETDLETDKTIALAGINWSLVKQVSCLQPDQLNVCCVQYSNQIEIEFNYNVKSFPAAAIEGWLRHYHTLLINVIENPTQTIEDLEILSDEEKEQTLFQFNPSLVHDSLENCLKSSCIHHLFEAQVQRTPQQIAVVAGGEELTYHQLNSLANQLAHHLRQLGVNPDDRVGICVERSPWLVVGLLGILKAGGAYVPLDPILPQERLKFMLENSQSEILITQQHLTATIPSYSGKVVVLDRRGEAIAHHSEANLETEVKPENLAYAIYTSGSTGNPKGVAIEHRQLFNYLQGITARLNLPNRASYALISTFGADLGNTVIFPSLCGGGCLHIISQENTVDPIALGNYFVAQGGIDCLKIVPSHLRALMQENPNSAQILPKKCLVLGGETTSWELVEQVQKFAPNCQIINHYGPTEATVGVLTYKVTQSAPEMGAATVPLGRPLPNTQIFLLDSQLRPVPVGFAGELYIGGDNLARGYLNQPHLTQDRFQSHPFNQQLTVKVKNRSLKLKITRGQWFNREAKFKIRSDDNTALDSKKRKFKLSERLYRTGDLARYLPDGNIEFLGRIDNQVKLHGFRIELGEIETQLKTHPSVRETVVIVSEKTPEDKRLVAYVVPTVKPAPKVSQLRHYLQKTLPEFMIPAAFVSLDRLPLTPNGKLDRQRLPDPETTRANLETSYIAPKTPQEQILALIWADVLNLEQVGVEDNFFELGGDSILSIQIVARAKAAGLGLKPIQLFQHQTIAELVKVVQRGEFKLPTGEISGQVPLIPIQHWFFQQSLPNPHHWNMSILLETPSELSSDRLETAIQHLIHHHDSLRLFFQLNESGWMQHYGEVGEKIACVYVDLSDIPDPALPSTLAAQATQLQSSLNLATPPLLRVAWFDLGKERGGRLLVIIHHLLMDGISWRIWLEDFRTIYAQLQRGEAIQLPDKTTSFKYWAQKLNDYAQSDTLSQELDYWLAQHPPFPSSLPQMQYTGLNSVMLAEKITVFLEAGETQAALHQVSRLQHIQMNELLLCGLLQTCQRWTGENHLLVELEGHGREALFEDVDLSRTLGWFTTRFPLLLSCDASVSPSQALQAVKETLRQIPNRGIGYGVLRYLNHRPEIAEKLSHLPQPEVCFNYLGQFTQENSIFSLLLENRGTEKSGLGQHTPSITIDAMVIEGQTRLELTYNPHLYQRETIETLARDYINSLKTLINDCLQNERCYTHNDFPLANLTQAQLDTISQQFSAIADIYPLSPLQQGLLFHSLYEAESNLYCQQKVFTLKASLNQAAFRQAWETVVNRHDSLKTAFIWENLATPLQIVQAAIALPWHEENWCYLSTSEQGEALANYLKTDLEQGFSFSDAPLMRMALFQLAEAKYYLVWSHHHLLLDGWCNGIIFQEVLTVYQALCEGEEPNLPPSPPYKSYIAWLNQQNDLKAKTFWKQALKGVKAPTRWGIPSPSEAKGNGNRRDYASEQFQLSLLITTALSAWAKSHHLTINTLIQGSFALLLSRYSGENDVIFGATVSGRPPQLPGVESLVGLLINTLPVRVNIDPQASLLDWLKQLQQQQMERLEYQYNSLVEIQQWSGVASGNSLFESFVAVENYPVTPSLREGNVKILDVQSFSRTNYPLSVTVELGSTLLMVMTYDPNQFTDMAIRRLLHQLQTLMENLPLYATQCLSEITITPAEEAQQLVDSFNADLD